MIEENTFIFLWAYRNQKAIRTGPWKLLVNPGNRNASEDRPVLFNLDDALGEKDI